MFLYLVKRLISFAYICSIIYFIFDCLNIFHLIIYLYYYKFKNSNKIIL